MKPPILRRLLVEDYPDAPSWFGRFISVLNQFMEQTVLVLSGRISLGDNIQSRTFSTSFTTSATYASGDFIPISFSWNGSSLPQLVLISSIGTDTGAPILTAVGSIQWRFSAGTITVTYISGLVPSTKYFLTVLAL